MRSRLSAIATLLCFAASTYEPAAMAQQVAPQLPATPLAPSVAVPPGAPVVSPVPAPSPDEIRHRRVTVDIDSTRAGTVVERRISLSETGGAYFFLPYHSTESTWEQVCVTPCSVDLDRFSTYRVGKVNGNLASRSFTLPQMADRFQLKIEPGSALGNRVGASASAIGLVGLIVGAGLIGGQKLFTDESAARTAGFISGAAGLVLLGVGSPVALLTQTKVLGGSQRVAITPRGLVF